MTTSVLDPAAVALVDVGDANAVASWTTLNDPVMGGSSTSHVEFVNGALVFSGVVSLENDGGGGQSCSYVQRFATTAGVEQTHDLPVDGFQPVGMRLAPNPDAPRSLDPSRVDQVSIYILDGQQGPFTITVIGIDATR